MGGKVDNQHYNPLRSLRVFPLSKDEDLFFKQAALSGYCKPGNSKSACMLKHSPYLYQDKNSAFRRPSVNFSVLEKSWSILNTVSSLIEDLF